MCKPISQSHKAMTKMCEHDTWPIRKSAPNIFGRRFFGKVTKWGYREVTSSSRLTLARHVESEEARALFTLIPSQGTWLHLKKIIYKKSFNPLNIIYKYKY